MDFNLDLDLVGAAIAHGLYTQITLCFPVQDPSVHGQIVETLRDGLERLAASFPWLAGQVSQEELPDGKSAVYKIKPLEEKPRLTIKEIKDGAITLDGLRKANFPMGLLEESIIARRRTMPDPSAADSPVFLIQATFIDDGLLLTFVGQHNCMDITGQGQIINYLSKACRNEAFTEDELATGNQVRTNLVPLLDESYVPGPELENQIVSSATTHASDDPGECSWASFALSSESLAALKSEAMRTVSSGYVSTDDALTAFIWQSIMRSRMPRLPDHEAECMFTRAVDARRYLNIPPTYLGMMQNLSYHSSPIHKLVKEPLGAIAAQLRFAVDPETSQMRYNSQALITYLARSEDKSAVNLTANLVLSRDIMLSSWSKVNSYSLDFGLGLGKPEAVRRPSFTPVESLVYLMPRAHNGEISVAACLRTEDWTRLGADEEFTRYAKYVG